MRTNSRIPSVKQCTDLAIDAAAGSLVFGRALTYAHQLPAQLGVNVSGPMLSYGAVAAASVATVALAPIPRQIYEGKRIRVNRPKDDQILKYGATGILMNQYMGSTLTGFALMVVQQFVKF